jgi:hypothetical protein
MANTFELISSVTVGGAGAASIDFTSIPSTFTDICLKWSGRTNNTSPNILISLNGSTSSFSTIALYGTGSATGSTNAVNRIASYSSISTDTGSTFSNSEIYIPNYAGSANKSISTDTVTENNGSTAYAGLFINTWANTAAINQITLTPSSGSFVQYSTAYLYGVKNA